MNASLNAPVSAPMGASKKESLHGVALPAERAALNLPPLQHEHEFEPVRGLPEALPAGEKMLWQGSPDWRLLAVQGFHVRKLVIYFAAMVALRLAFMATGDAPATLGAMAVSAAWLLGLSAAAVGGLAAVAWLSARGTVYTITSQRVVMRIGIVLTLTFNIPFRRITGANLRLDADGHGDVPLALNGADRIAYLHLWPHARPWHVARPEPMLRCLPQAADVARLLSAAWSAHTGLNAVAAPPVAGAAHAEHSVRKDAGRGLPALANP